ncbi:MAG: hypothetical protein HZC36_11955 [Armatimonadetes bacterium]|nr:hypothetical protein [Armatimonadota bacterium]
MPEIIAALGFFGAVVVFPITFLLLRHQRSMAEILHRGNPGETQQRLEALEQTVRELRAAHYDRVIREDDRKELSGSA